MIKAPPVIKATFYYDLDVIMYGNRAFRNYSWCLCSNIYIIRAELIALYCRYLSRVVNVVKELTILNKCVVTMSIVHVI